MPIVGYGNHVVNTLRIWDAQAITDFKLDAFDRGEYHKAIEHNLKTGRYKEILLFQTLNWMHLTEENTIKRSSRKTLQKRS